VAFAQRPCANQGKRPMLELEFVQLRQPFGAAQISGLSALFKLDFFAEGIFETAFDEVDGEIGDINADPLAAELLRGMNRCAAAAEWVENDVPLFSGER